MKAGIYQTPNGNLIYVAKDRTLTATTLLPSSWPGTKVSHRSKDDTVLIANTTYRCHRVADVPNGCNDHLAALHAFEAERAERTNQQIGMTATVTNPRPIEEQARELEGIAKDLRNAGDEEGAKEFEAGAEAVRNGGGFKIAIDYTEIIPPPVKPEVSDEWKRGREDKPFSKHVVHGHGPGFLSRFSAEAEHALLSDLSRLRELEGKGIIRYVAHDEWEVVDADRYKEFLSSCETPRVPRVPPELGAPFVAGGYRASLGEDPYEVAAVALPGWQEGVEQSISNSMGLPSRMLREGSSPPNVTTQGVPSFPFCVSFYLKEKQRAHGSLLRKLDQWIAQQASAEGYRHCHKLSARKHRKAGHHVIPVGDGSFFWKARN